METILTTFGTVFLLACVSGIFYVVYRVLKYAFITVKNNDD